MEWRKQSGECPTCRKASLSTENSQLREALLKLEKKNVQLATVMAEYMSEAGLDRRTRALHATEMAQALIRIVGGRVSLKGSYPECCLVGQANRNGTETWSCSGVLIAPRLVITAAHCHDPRADVVALGAETTADLSNAEIIRARRTVVHPEYGDSEGHDIAVLVLRRDAQTKPVPLASEAELKAARRVTLVGFGNNNFASTRGFGTKREVEVRITHLRRREADDLDEAEAEMGFESDFEFVAGGDGYDSCQGDSGGPAYIGSNHKRVVAGVTSRPSDASIRACGDGGVYTRLDAHRAFIHRVAKDAGVSVK